MAILRVPKEFFTIQEAVNAANPGDVILVEEGTYPEQVIITKSNIRLVARCRNAVLDGNSLLDFGFLLNNVSGVQVRDFIIQNYDLAGVYLNGGQANRVIQNNIINNDLAGIILNNSCRNMIAENNVSQNDLGILATEANHNWFVRNCACQNAQSGIFLGFGATGSNDNALINNYASNNESIGILALGYNNLLLQNQVTRNQVGILLEDNNNLIQGNIVKRNERGAVVAVNSENLYLANNVIRQNCGTGIELVNNQFGIIEENKIIRNQDFAIKGSVASVSNTIIRNRIRFNSPGNIDLINPDNNVINSCLF